MISKVILPMVGNAIRRVRQGKSLKLKDLANKTGFSVSYLSQVELGKIEPSLTALRKISNALERPVFSFLLEERDFEKNIIKKNQRKTIKAIESAISLQLLTPDVSRQLEMIYWEVEPGEYSSTELLSHHGEECTFVISGKGKFEFENGSASVEAGDSIYIPKNVVHRTFNPGIELFIAVTAITPPSY